MGVDNSTQKQILNLKILPNGCFNIAILIGNGALVTLKKQKNTILLRFTSVPSLQKL
jgi:hypothetical protein